MRILLVKHIKKDKFISIKITYKPKKIYIIRHGEPYGNFKSKKYLGQKDPPLSKLGILQAKYWKQFFSCTEIDGIYTSDLTRAVQTAKIISEGHSLIELQYLSKIREINLGNWDGMDFKTIREKYPYSFNARGLNLKKYRPPNGESFSDLRNRVLPAFNKIIDNTYHKTIIVSHAGVNRIIIANILKIPINRIFDIKQSYGAMNKIIINEDKVKIVIMNYKPIIFI